MSISTLPIKLRLNIKSNKISSDSGSLTVPNTIQSTSTTTGALVIGGGVGVAKDVYVGDNLLLKSDSAVFKMGDGDDFTITHGGDGATLAGTPITITSASAATWSTSAGALTIDAVAAELTLDGHTGVTVKSTNSGDITLDSVADVVLDADGDQVSFKFGGATGQLDVSNTNSGDITFQQKTDGKDIVFKQYDGNEVLRLTDAGNVTVASNLTVSSNYIHLVTDNGYINFGTVTSNVESTGYGLRSNNGTLQTKHKTSSSWSTMGRKVSVPFETDYISTASNTKSLLIDECKYYIADDSMTLSKLRLTQMGEVGNANYTITANVLDNDAGVLTVNTSTATNVLVVNINGINTVNHYSQYNEPTKTGLVFHFPLDYSKDDVMGNTTIHGGELVKQPRLGFRAFNAGNEAGCHTSVFDLGGYDNNWTICYWFKVIHQDPRYTYLALLRTYDTNLDTSTELWTNGFAITLNNKTSYNTKPYDDYRISCYNSSGSAINLTSSQASYGSGTTTIYFDDATGKYMDTWTHFAFQRDGANLYHLYQDGVLIADITTASTITSPSDTSIKIGGANYLHNQTSSSVIDDIRFYRTTLSATDIATFSNVITTNNAGGLTVNTLSSSLSLIENQLLELTAKEESSYTDSGTERLKVELLGTYT